MKINRISESCLKILVRPKKGKKINILIDPFNGRIKTKIDILLLTEAGRKTITCKGKPFLISGPGEYEVQDVFIRGISARKSKEQNQSDLTIYTIESGRMRTCYLGHFGQRELTSRQLETIGAVDVLIVPVAEALLGKEIQKIVSQVEPKVIIPIEYKKKKLKAKLRDFLKEMGIKKIEQEKGINLKRKEIKEEETRIIVLKTLKS